MSADNPCKCGSFETCGECRKRIQAAAGDLLKAAKNCIIPLQWARDHIDPLVASKVQANINAINAAVDRAEGRING